ncbi:MAG: hypothetical protein WC284_14770 [Candidimonas sp.]
MDNPFTDKADTFDQWAIQVIEKIKTHRADYDGEFTIRILEHSIHVRWPVTTNIAVIASFGKETGYTDIFYSNYSEQKTHTITDMLNCHEWDDHDWLLWAMTQ